MGVFSLHEIGSIRLPYGMRIERDLTFATPHSLSRWAAAARRTGSIIHAEQLLIRAEPDAVPDLPGDPDAGTAG